MKRQRRKRDFLFGVVDTLHKYSGKCIGVVDNKIVAIGRDAIEAFEKVREKFPERKEGIGIYYIPTKEEIVTALWNFPILPVRFSGLEFKAPIGFSKELGVGFNLLGRAGFFEKFRICFNDRDKKVETMLLT